MTRNCWMDQHFCTKPLSVQSWGSASWKCGKHNIQVLMNKYSLLRLVSHKLKQIFLSICWLAQAYSGHLSALFTNFLHTFTITIIVFYWLIPFEGAIHWPALSLSWVHLTQSNISQWALGGATLATVSQWCRYMSLCVLQKGQRNVRAASGILHKILGIYQMWNIYTNWKKSQSEH